MLPNTTVPLEISLHCQSNPHFLSACPFKCVGWGIHIHSHQRFSFPRVPHSSGTWVSIYAFKCSSVHACLCLLLQGYLQAFCLTGMNELVLFFGSLKAFRPVQRTHISLVLIANFITHNYVCVSLKRKCSKSTKGNAAFSKSLFLFVLHTYILHK